MEETEQSGGYLPLGIADAHNLPEEENKEPEGIKELVLTTEIKVLVGCIFLAGIGYCLYAGSLTGLLIWGVGLGFIMDIMGVFDSFKTEAREISKPGGYENIE